MTRAELIELLKNDQEVRDALLEHKTDVEKARLKEFDECTRVASQEIADIIQASFRRSA